MEIAAQLFTVREYTKTEEGVLETFRKVKAMGYDSVQISAFGFYEPDRIRAMLDECGLTVCATHTPLDRIADDTDAVIAEHKLFGCRYVGLGWMRADTIDGYRAILDRLAPALDKLYDAGLKFVYHNHAHEFQRIGGERDGRGGVRPIELMAEYTEPEKFGFLADMYWIQKAGCSPVKFIGTYADRLDVVHFKDMRVPPEGKSDMAEVFAGNMDYEAIYAACLAAGVQYAAVEQDTCDGNPFDSLAVSRANIKRILKL